MTVRCTLLLVLAAVLAIGGASDGVPDVPEVRERELLGCRIAAPEVLEVRGKDTARPRQGGCLDAWRVVRPGGAAPEPERVADRAPDSGGAWRRWHDDRLAVEAAVPGDEPEADVAEPQVAPVLDAPEAALSDDLAERLALAALVAAAFPDAPLMASHVVWAESMGDWAGSNWRCNVYGPCWSPTQDCGLGQINIIHAAKFTAHGWNIYVDCFVPERNIVIMREIYDAQGLSAWTTAR